MQKPKTDIMTQSMKSPLKLQQNTVINLPQFRTSQKLPQFNRISDRSKSRGPSQDKSKPDKSVDKQNKTEKKVVIKGESPKIVDDEPEIKFKRAPSPGVSIPLRQSTRQLRPINKKVSKASDDNVTVTYTTQPVNSTVAETPTKYNKGLPVNNDVISSYVNLIKDNIVKKNEIVVEEKQIKTKKLTITENREDYYKIISRLLYAIIERYRFSKIQRAFIYLRINSQSLRNRYLKFTKLVKLKLTRKVFKALRNQKIRKLSASYEDKRSEPISKDISILVLPKTLTSHAKPKRIDVDEAIRSYLPKPQVVDDSPFKLTHGSQTPQKKQKIKPHIDPKPTASIHKEVQIQPEVEEEDLDELPDLMARTFRKDKCTE